MTPYDHSRSDALYATACQRIPGGVNSPVRAFKSVHGQPIYFARASGAEVVDVDGNRYVDFCNSWGPLILGHADADVIRAVQEAAPAGLTYGACHEGEILMAERILASFPGMQRVRLVSSGTEAVMTALRLARGITKRPLVLKFEGGYHGHVDSLLVKAGSGLVTGAEAGAEPSSAGVSAATAAQTLTLPFDDLPALEQAFAHHGDEIAAIIIEPMPANNGLLVQAPGYLQALRDLCDRHCSLLIFDEVISGFRLHNGGYGQLAGVQPDLVTLGKIIGGGMPVGAIVGPAPFLDQLAPLGPVYQAGTLSGNPISIAAGLATLTKLADPKLYARLDALGERLEQQLAASGLPWLRVTRQGSVVWPYFDEGPIPRTAAAISPVAVRRFNAMFQSVLQAGCYLPPSAYEVLFLSAAHTPAHIDQLAGALTTAARSVAAHGVA
jgi:glutamate-1-semialdehyde 2,1-aminomutase